MATENFKKAGDIFENAIEIDDPTKREDYLKNACEGDKELRAEVDALLRAHEKSGDFLEVSAVEPISAQIEGPGTKIGRYELLELLDEGGMGLVYLAEQGEPVKRRVALKIVKLGMDTKQVIARFEAERQTLALLEHPNIAHVFDAGTTETGRPYFVMEYVEGKSITKYCDEHKLSIEERLGLFRQLCEGVHHAHQKGIIHRDIKPSNILVSIHGDRIIPKIIDFGIAKAITQPLTEKTSYTEHGQLLGTPEYMSPEQAEMACQDVDTRSDIYSLGVMLYELLAGATPFDAKRLREGGIDQIKRVICEEEPITPSARLTSLGDKAKTVAESRKTQIITLTRRLHRELEWIPMKAMRKDRTRRYRSASELADDIQNYLTGTPLIAGPESTVYRTRKFVRKHAGSVASAALVAVVIVLGLITSTVFSFKAEKARGQEAAARIEAEQARDKEAALRAEVEQALERAEKAEAIAEERSEDYRQALYVNSIQLADAKYREGNVGRARKLLESCPEDLRGWEWNRVNHVLDQSLMTLDADKRWVWSVSLSPDGKSLVTGGGENTLKVWDITTGKALTTLSGAHTGSINRVQFSPNGRHIVSGDSRGEIKVWDAADVNEEVISMRHGSSWVRSAAFSPDNKQLVSIARGSEEIKVWDVATGSEIRSFGGNPDVCCALFSRDGKRIISGDLAGVIRILDATSGKELMKFTEHEDSELTMSLSSDGTLLASGCLDSTIKMWDVMTGSLVMTLRGHQGPIRSIAFSQDDKYLVSGADDCKVIVWNVTTGAEIMTMRGHEGSCDSVTFTPDGKQIVSGSWDGKVKVWDAILDHEVNRFLGHKGSVCSIAFSPDGRRLVSHGLDGELKVWDVASASEVMTLKSVVGVTRARGLVSTAFSPDGKQIASLGLDCAISVWNAETGAEVTRLGGHKENARCLAFSPNGKRIVSGSNGGEIKLWDVVDGEEIMTWSANGHPVLSVAFSPDGKRIVSGHRSGKVWIWDAVNSAQLMQLKGHEGAIFCVAFSPDGKRIASACQEDRTVKLWDAVTGTELKTLRGHGWYLYSLAFSPNGKRLVTGGWDRTARVWDTSTGDELLTLPADLNVNCVAFSPDGKTIAGGTLANTILLWDSAAPADGYGPRKTSTRARNIVDELYETHGFYHDIIDKLVSDTALAEPVRKVALQIANSRKVEDAEMLAKEGWDIVSSADKDVDAYKSIVDKAQKIARSEPKNPSILRTLGVGLYRVGAYSGALDTLKHAEKIRTDDNLESDPNILAFLATTQYHLGQVDEGRSAINAYRDSLEDMSLGDITLDKFSGSSEIEAEKVFAGTDKQLLTIWELIDTKELDRAVEMFFELQFRPEGADSDFAFSFEGLTKYLSRACYVRGKSRLLDNDQGNIDIASDYEAAVRIDPNYVSALKDLAWLQATCPVEEVRNPTTAVDLATRACELTDWKNHEYLSVLAGACSESEQFIKAVKWQQEAIALLSEEDQADWASNYRERMRLYEAGMPYSAGPRWSFTEGELVSFWDFNDVQDGVVNNRIVGGPQVKLADGGQIVADNERGNVLDLRGSKVECTQEPDFDITGAISYGAWIKLRPSMEGWHAIVSKGERGERGWAMSAHTGGYVTMSINVLKDEEFLMGLAKNPTRYLPVSANTDIKDDRWHHVVGTYDGEKVCVYVDGELGHSKPIQGHIVTNNGPVVIGDNPEWSGDWSWNGFIDDVCIYSYALSTEEVKDLYEGREAPQTAQEKRK